MRRDRGLKIIYRNKTFIEWTLVITATISSCNVVFGIFLQNTILLTEIRIPGWEVRTIWGGNFPLDYLFPLEYFLIDCYSCVAQ
jgi:hypothetical protein